MAERRNEEAETDEGPTTTRLLQEIASSQMPDLWLALWVSIVDRSEDVSIGITLMVQGTVVSGDLVSGRVYFEGLAREVRDIGTGDAAEAYAATLDKGAEMYPVMKLRHESDDPDDDKADPAYVHLRNAHVLSSSGAPIQGINVWWRGRLSSVDAFWMGTIREA